MYFQFRPIRRKRNLRRIGGIKQRFGKSCNKNSFIGNSSKYKIFQIWLKLFSCIRSYQQLRKLHWIIVDWICMALFKTPKAPDRVSGSIHSHTVILVLVNYDSSHSCPGTDWQKCGCHSAPTGPPKTYSKVGDVYCPRTQQPWCSWTGGDQTAYPPNIGRPALPPEPRSS